MNKRQKKKFKKKYERKIWRNKKNLDKIFDRFVDDDFRYLDLLTDVVADSAGIPKELLEVPLNLVKHYKYQTPLIPGNRVDQMTLHAAQRYYGENHPTIVSLKRFKDLDYSDNAVSDSNNNDK